MATGRQVNTNAKMSINFYDPELEVKLRSYVSSISSNNNAVLNRMVELVVGLEREFSDDMLDNLSEIKDLLVEVNWDDIRQIRASLSSKPLTRNAQEKGRFNSCYSCWYPADAWQRRHLTLLLTISLCFI